MGRVIRGRSRDGELVAIKVSTRPDHEIDKNFEREVEIAARLSRGRELAHVVGVHGLIELEGRRALVMEYADGGSLTHFLKRVEDLEENELDAQSIRLIATSVLRGLRELHDNDPPILHRDIKPSNVLRVRGKWKLADFGISGFRDRPPSPGTVGQGRTPAYAPPEQGHGAVDQTVDFYAFAKTMIHVLTGDPENPVPLGLPAEIDRVLRDCLETEPQKRPQSVGEILERLDPGWDKLSLPLPAH